MVGPVDAVERGRLDVPDVSRCRNLRRILIDIRKQWKHRWILPSLPLFDDHNDPADHQRSRRDEIAQLVLHDMDDRDLDLEMSHVGRQL